MVLELSIRTSASTWRQWSHWGLRVTQDAYFSLLTHTKQLFQLHFVIQLQEIQLVFGHTDGRTDGRIDGRTPDGPTNVKVEIFI